jgi:hypothetical protein
MSMTKAHARYLEVLLDRISADQYPSGELMDRVEILLDRDHVDEYVDMLFQRVEACQYPSKQLLDRIARLTLAAS